MPSRLTISPRGRSAKKRALLWCGAIGLSFLATACFGLIQRMQAAGNILPDRQVSAAPTKTQPRLAASYGKLPLSFEANQGQTDARVRFLARGSGYTIFLAGGESVLSLRKSQPGLSRFGKPGLSSRFEPSGPVGPRAGDWPNLGGDRKPLWPSLIPGLSQMVPEPNATKGDAAGEPKPEAAHVVRMRLVGANPNARTVGLDELPGRSNYFIGNDPKKWRTNVPNYTRVMFEGVYPGVDLVYYGNQRQLEYDLVLAPGVDPNQIKLSFEGADGMRLDASSGDLVLKLGAEELRFRKPAVYQPAVAAAAPSPAWSGTPASGFDSRHSPLVTGHSSFVLAGNNQVAFRVTGYDPTRALVIDPILSYSTYLGGSGGDEAHGIAVDSSGNACVTGQTASADFPTAGPLQASYGGGTYDVFVAKLNAAGSALVYSTYLGGSNYDYGHGIAVDSSGDAYITGETASTNFPTVNPLQATNDAAQGTGFVAELNAAGSALVYSTYLGGTGSDSGNAIAIDPAGDAYVAGSTSSSDFPIANPIQSTYAGGTCGAAPNTYACPDVFVTKLNPAGSALVYSTYLGGTASDSGSAIAIDPAGDAYVTGQTFSTDFPTANPFQATNKTAEGTGFVAELNAAGSALVYSTYLGGSSVDDGTGIAADSSGNAYVTGETTSTDFPVTAGALKTVLTPNALNAFVTKLNPAGSALVYSTFLGGSVSDWGGGIVVDSSGTAYVAGTAQSPDFPTANPVQATLRGASNAFIARLNAAGSALLYSTYLGGSGSDEGLGIAIDSSGNAYVTGYTGSTDFPTLNPLQAANRAAGPNPDTAFVAKLSLAPGASLSAQTLAFGSVIVNTTAPEQTVTLTSTGDTSLNITGIAASGDFALATTATSCPYSGGSVASLANCTIDVIFTPTAAGGRTGTVTITDNASGSPQTIGLTGAGIVSAPIVSPLSLAFSDQLIATTSASQPVTITNTSPVALSIAGLAISSDWTETNNCLPSIAPLATCTINVSFHPTAQGARAGTLILTDYALGSPQVVDLSGTGLAPAVSLSATSLTFGTQTVSTTSLPQTITLTNTGTGVLTPLTVTTSGDFAQTNSCAGSVPVSDPSSPLASDNFQRADGPLGGSWEYFPNNSSQTGMGGIQILNNAFGPADASGGDAYAIWPGTFSNDQWAQAEVSTVAPPTSTVAITAAVRIGSETTYTYTLTSGAPLLVSQYIVITGMSEAGNNSGTNNLIITRLGAGTFTVTNRSGVTAYGQNGVGVSPSDSGAGLVVRGSADGLNGYYFSAGTNSFDGIGTQGFYRELWKYVDGVGYWIRGIYTPFPDVPGDIYLLTVVGARLTVYRNGVIWMTLLDSSLAAGSPGIWTWSLSGPEEYNWANWLNPAIMGTPPGNSGTRWTNWHAGSIGSCVINVTFTPTASGSRSGSLTFTDNAGDSPQTVSLSGTAAVGAVQFSPTSLSFANQNVSTTSTPQTVTLSNNGTTPLNISIIATSGDFAQTNNCGSSVIAGGNCTISVTFTPITAGTRSGALTITDNAVAGSTQTVPLSGTGVGPTANLPSFSRTFSDQMLGTTSASHAVTLINAGNVALTISNITASGDFSQTNNCNTSLAANSYCTMNVTFTPSATGARNGTLAITDDSDYAPGSTQTVSLAGTGTAPVAEVSHTGLTFGGQLANTASAAQAVTLSNSGDAALTVSNIATSANFRQTNDCGSSVAPGASCSINVTFTPSAGGSLSGTLTITDNSNGVAGSTQTISLSGTGQDFTLTVASGSTFTANVAPGQSATYTLSVAGQGGFNQSVTFACARAPSGATCAFSPSTLIPGSSAANVTVTVTTTAPASSVPRSRPLLPVPPLSPGLKGLLTLALALVAIAWAIGRRNRPVASRWRAAIIPLASALLLTLALAGCGGGSSTRNLGTPAGTYTLTVTGSTGSGSHALSHSVTLTLNVS
jgi:hypothetical protein